MNRSLADRYGAVAPAMTVILFGFRRLVKPPNPKGLCQFDIKGIFSYTHSVMVPASAIARKNYLPPAVFYALVFAIFSLSLQDDWDLEIFVSQTTHSFVGKVSKDSKANHGGQREAGLAAAAVHWTPSFEPHFFLAADAHNLPALFRLDSVSIRAPPSPFPV
jgi:hypothetical protein